MDSYFVLVSASGSPGLLKQHSKLNVRKGVRQVNEQNFADDPLDVQAISAVQTELDEFRQLVIGWLHAD